MNSRFKGTLTVKEIAEWIGKSEVFVRKSIENGSLEIGAYTRGDRGSYYISPKLAWERLGYRRDETSIDHGSDDSDKRIDQSGSSREVLGNSLLSDRHNSEWNLHDRE